MNDRGVPSLVVFDLSVTCNSPAGSCVLAELTGLRHDYDITVFSGECDLGQETGVKWIRVPLPPGPVFIRYWIFQVLAALRFIAWRMRNPAPAIIQTTQGQFSWPDVAYAHFCHRAYLRNQWKFSTVRGLRRAARWMNHVYNAFAEGRAFVYAKKIVVPSHGLARDLATAYPEATHKIAVIANPVDVERFSAPPDFDRTEMRDLLGLEPNHVALSFLALGNFSAKGLDIIVEALTLLSSDDASKIRVVVIGGKRAEIKAYKDIASRAGVARNVQFVGFQRDPRPYLWASDLFVFPSIYETFSLAIHEAAASGLPVITTTGLYGAEDLIEHGRNGWLVARNPETVGAALRHAVVDHISLARMGMSARETARRYNMSTFVRQWRELLGGVWPT